MRLRYAVLAGAAVAAVLGAGTPGAAAPKDTRPTEPPLFISDLGVGTTANAINHGGQVAGSELMGDGTTQAFVWTPATANGTTFAALQLPSLPGATFSAATALNDGGEVVGVSANRAVEWSRSGSGYGIVALPGLGGQISRATGINANGQAVGFAQTAQGPTHAVLWTGGTPQDLGTLPGGRFSVALGIDGEGYVVGFSDVGSTAQHGFAFTHGSMIDLGPGIAFATNGKVVVGQAPSASDPSVRDPAIWSASGSFPRLPLSLTRISQAELFSGVNSKGASVGAATGATGGSNPTSSGSAILYQPCAPGQSPQSGCNDVVDLNTRVASAAGRLVTANGINAVGQIVAAMVVGAANHAVVLTAPPAECLCKGIDIKVSPVNFTDEHTFEFKIRWTIHCTGGSEKKRTCAGEIKTLDPCLVTNVGCTPGSTDLSIAKSRKLLACAGRCDRLSSGTFFIVGHARRDLLRKQRAGKSYGLRFELFCGTGKSAAPLPLPAAKPFGYPFVKVVYDARGFLDQKASSFGQTITASAK